jgi:hypothetical protein
MIFHWRVSVSAPDKSASTQTPKACGEGNLSRAAGNRDPRPESRGFFMDNSISKVA